MSQGLLGFKYEEEKKNTGMTALAGLPIYLDLASAIGIGDSIEKHLHIKQQGWTDRQTLLSLIMTNLAGGDCVEDLRKLESDTGFCEGLRRLEQRGMKRRESDRRWRKERSRTVPSSSSIFRYLSAFHDKDEEKKRVEGKAFIPVPNEHLRGLAMVNAEMVGYLQFRHFQQVATLDQDATLVATTKRDALYSYKGFKAYQPLNTWWAEQGAVLYGNRDSSGNTDIGRH
jgi:hypothetical protein